jgi:hypothetical protein
MWLFGLDSIGLGYGQVSGCYKHVHKHSGSIKFSTNWAPVNSLHDIQIEIYRDLSELGLCKYSEPGRKLLWKLENTF